MDKSEELGIDERNSLPFPSAKAGIQAKPARNFLIDFSPPRIGNSPEKISKVAGHAWSQLVNTKSSAIIAVSRRTSYVNHYGCSKVDFHFFSILFSIPPFLPGRRHTVHF